MFDSYKNKKDLPITQEEPKYKSKKESSVSHSSIKSKHKHVYAPCKFTYSQTYAIPDNEPKIYHFTDVGTYCIICGRIGQRSMHYREDKKKQFDLENPNAPIFTVEGYRDKFVDIS